jgi:phosphoserine phosphatase RsbX
VEWGASTRTRPGESESGDRHVVQTSRNGVLLAAVDGLGHGPEAAEAAVRAVEVLKRHGDESINSLVKRCHADLRGTRGVVLSIASFDATDDTMTWLGVGNVEGALIRKYQKTAADHEMLLLRGGVVGVQLPELRTSVLPVASGDTLVFATDGIGGDFTGTVKAERPAQEIADLILERYTKGTDDALVLVARYL